MRDYQPTIVQMTGFKSQTMSLRECGEFDKTHTTKTLWHKVSMERNKAGISRKARIKAARNA